MSLLGQILTGSIAAKQFQRRAAGKWRGLPVVPQSVNDLIELIAEIRRFQIALAIKPCLPKFASCSAEVRSEIAD
jgi:hypothetical protein